MLKVLLFLFFHVPVFCLAKNYYGTYSHAPQGSTRALGLGGAYTGLSDDASGVIYNPAGLGFGNFIFDLGQTDNYTFNKEADIDNNGELDGVPFQYQFSSVALKWNFLSVGYAQSTPFLAQMSSAYGAQQNATIKVSSQDLILAIRIGDKVSLGVLSRSQTLKEEYNNFSSQNLVTTAKANNFIYGFSFRPEKKLGFGITYTPNFKIEADTSLNQNFNITGSLDEYGWFNGVVFPEKITLGGFYAGSENIVYIADLDFIKAPADTIYLKNPFTTPMYTNTDIKPYQFQIPHGGVEFTVFKDSKKEFIWRVGGYREPARVVGASDRLHFTMGVEVKMGPLIASASMDETNGFSNSSQSISFTLGEKK